MEKSDKELTNDILAAKKKLNEAIQTAAREGLEVCIDKISPMGEYEHTPELVDVTVLRHLC